MKKMYLVWTAALVFAFCLFSPKPVYAALIMKCKTAITTVSGSSSRETVCWWADDGMGNSGGGSGTPVEPKLGDGGNQVDRAPYPPQICSMLSAMGRPKDCNQSLADEWDTYDRWGYTLYLNKYGNLPFMPAFTRMDMSRSLATQNFYLSGALLLCYRNPARDPDACEADYRQGFIDAYNGAWHSDNDVRNFPQGISDLDNRLANARQERWVASWFKAEYAVEYRGFGITAEFPLFESLFGPYSKAFTQARKGDACMNWYAAWNSSSCSSYYGGGG